MRKLEAGLSVATVVTVLGAPLTAVPAYAQSCPNNPNALGTSRVLAVDPAELPRVGRMQYPDSLPLADHEVVLTFDDGPLPPYSNQILDILASQCVKATYFLVGEMAHTFPAVVRRIYQEGHTIGTHSEDHPTHFERLPAEKMEHEIDDGIADVGAALGDAKAIAPFFRIPGLARSDEVEDELAARGLVVFSSDTVADDWHHRITPSQIIALALSRLEARGKGILLLHDIHPTTVAALPGLLLQLRQHGFQVVQVVPAATDEIEVARKSDLRMFASAMAEPTMMDDSSGAPTWPDFHTSLNSDRIVFPAPDAKSFDIGYHLGPKASPAAEHLDAHWPAPARALASVTRIDPDVTGSTGTERQPQTPPEAFGPFDEP
jgi:peptidoglycan/xylan/chitin deacetylase (PgdA/CDA1 family)